MTEIEGVLQRGRRHLDQLHAEWAASAGPCSRCKFGRRRSYTRYCIHPAIREGHFEPSTGKLVWTDKQQDEVRTRGACGPTGRLFVQASTAERIGYVLRAHSFWIIYTLAVSVAVIAPILIVRS